MRSVVVVLPASICAAMPIFREQSSGVCRGINTRPYSLPAVMRERPIGFRHLVRVFALLHRRAAIARGVHQLPRKSPLHGWFVAAAGSRDDPADGECARTLGAHFHWYLIGRATHTA